MRDQTALVLALRYAGHTPEEIAGLLDGWVWLGDLSGMEVFSAHQQICVTHRCGRGVFPQPRDGMSTDDASLLGNLVVRAVRAREGHSCRGDR